MGLTRIVPPAIEPVSLQEAKLHLRQDETADDTLITSLIIAAREYVENQTGRALITQQWRLSRDTLPAWDGAIRLGRAPLISVESVKFFDEAGTEFTLASTDYIVDTSATHGEIALAYGLSWPVPALRRNAVRVDFTAGYGPAASDVPAALKAAMLLVVGDLYLTREAGIVGTIHTVNPAVANLLGPYTLPLVA